MAEVNESSNLRTDEPLHRRGEHKLVVRVALIVLEITTALVVGFMIGFLLEKSKAYEPIAIKEQFVFRNFIPLKALLAVVASSTLSILVLNLIFKNPYNYVFNVNFHVLAPKSVFVLVAGGLLLGIGMQICGACPATLFVQLGAGVPWSYITLVGALLGALVHGLSDTYVTETTEHDRLVTKTMSQALKNIHPVILQATVVVLLTLTVFLLEFFIANGIATPSANIFRYRAWPPAACGAIIGFLQFPFILVLHQSLRVSSAYTTLVGVPVAARGLQDRFRYLAIYRRSLLNWLTLLVALAMIIGSFTSSWTTGVFHRSIGVHPYSAFFGGFLMAFGARVSGGHLISGLSHQFIGSLLISLSLLASGIFLGFYVFLATYAT